MVERIKERIKELEAKLNMNSSNSSKPPSTDNKLTKKRKEKSTSKKKRGRVAIDAMELIPNYEGILVHDHWSPYNHYTNCTHSYCNAHILRELNGISEKEHTLWSTDMHKLLTNMNNAVHDAKDKYMSRILSFIWVTCKT